MTYKDDVERLVRLAIENWNELVQEKERSQEQFFADLPEMISELYIRGYSKGVADTKKSS